MQKHVSTFTILLFLTLIVGSFWYWHNTSFAQQNELPILVKQEKPLKAPRPLFVPGELIIKFKQGASEREIDNLKIAQQAEEKYKSRFTNARTWKVSSAKTVEQWAGFFDKHPLVEYAEPNYYAYASMTPNDTLYYLQWHLDNSTYGGINMEAAWDVNTGSSDVVVAVLDTGVAYEDHPAPEHWHIDTYNAYGGSGNSWWLGLNESAWATEPGYGNGWKDYLQHTFDLTSATGTITFSYKYRHDLERNFDFAYTEISTNGGVSWTTLKTYTSKTRGPQNTWKSESLNITSYAGNNILIRFRGFSDEIFSDEDGSYDSDGAFFVDEISLDDSSGNIFFDNVESGSGSWETTQYEQAHDLAGTNFWVNSGETAGNSIDDDSNGYIDDINGWDFINSDPHPNDDDGHGTHVTGTVAQTTNNNAGVAGIAFDTTIMPIKILGADGSGFHSQIADGIHYAVNNGAKIINMSLGGPASSTLENAIAYAYTNGVTVIAACGNSNTSSCDYPAAYNSYVIAVGATQYDETRAPYSDYGSSLDIVAPGGNTGLDQNSDSYADGVLQNTFGDTPVDWAYWFYQGTSMATPHASGVAALLLAENSSLTPSQIKSTLESTAEDLGTAGRDDTYGWGLIDAEAALASLSPPVSITLSTDGTIEFGILGLGDTQDTTASGLNDVQTVTVDTGPVDLDIRTTTFSDNGNSWSLGSSNGVDQAQWEFSPDGSSWTTFTAAYTLFPLASSVSQGATQDTYFRLTMPTSTTSNDQYDSDITIVASSP